MKKNKTNELRIAFNSIKCPSEVDNKIFEHLNKKQWKYKPIMVVISILFVSIITIGVVNAEEIAKKVYNFFVSTSDTNNSGTDINLTDSSISEIKYDASFPECGDFKDSKNVNCTNKYTKQELEEMLGVKLLSNSLYTDENYNLVYSKYNENKIASLSFQLSENITDDSKINENSNHNIYKSFISLKTKYTENNDNTLITGGTHEYEIYHIKRLDTDALIMKSAGQYILDYNITFVHNNLIYSTEILFKGSKQQNPDDIVIKFLESFNEN